MWCEAIVFDEAAMAFNAETTDIVPPKDAVFLARVLCAGVCGTDLQVLRGERKVQTAILGHEGLLQVTEVLSSDCPFGEGELVVVNPTHPSIPDLVVGHSRDGLFAKLFYGRQIDLEADALIAYPDIAPPSLASLSEPLAVALMATELTRSILSRSPGTVGVIGAGSIGLCIAQLFALSGTRVIMVESSPSRVDYVNSLEWPGVLAVTHLQHEYDRFDLVLLAVPPCAAIGAWEMVAPWLADHGVVDFVCDIPRHGRYVEFHDVRRAVIGGRCAGAGFVTARTRTGVPFKAIGHRGVGSAHIRRALNLLASAPERFYPLVTHSVSAASFCRAASGHKNSGKRTFEGREWVKMSIDWSIEV